MNKVFITLVKLFKMPLDKNYSVRVSFSNNKVWEKKDWLIEGMILEPAYKDENYPK